MRSFTPYSLLNAVSPMDVPTEGLKVAVSEPMVTVSLADTL